MAEAQTDLEREFDAYYASPIRRIKPDRSSNIEVVMAVVVGLILLVLYLAWPVFDDLGMLH